ncbi:MAG: hypothetical protein Fur0025_03360 [Oscillatoriaceae cyanobacterium]
MAGGAGNFASEETTPVCVQDISPTANPCPTIVVAIRARDTAPIVAIITPHQSQKQGWECPEILVKLNIILIYQINQLC